MTVSAPTPSQLQKIAEQCGIALTEDDARSYRALMGGLIAGYNVMDQMADETPPVRYARLPGRRPGAAENPLNAWYVRTEVKGAASGKLAGKTVVLKDNVMLAGVPLMNGAATLEGYTPDMDATIVGRILDAGGTIVGKANSECFGLSTVSFTSASGAVHNPHKHGHSAGGSSSGCGALVADGEADMAIGGDQGGSIRIPSAMCGIYGMKPTWGLVPYTGILPLENWLDHTGPMTRTVKDNALLLEVIAGDDGYDQRIKMPEKVAYGERLGGGAAGLRIGVVKEGFGTAESQDDVDAKVRAAARHFARLGATVEDISIPEHHLGGVLTMPIGMEGFTQMVMWGDGYGTSRKDLYATSLMNYHHAWRSRINELPPTAKLSVMFGTFIREQHGTRFYGKAMNLARRMIAAYDAALGKYDLLLMPTSPMKAQKLPTGELTPDQYLANSMQGIANTSPFNLSHHPAMSIPCGLSEGLPIGVMLIGRHFDEATIYRAAHAFEQSGDWKAM